MKQIRISLLGLALVLLAVACASPGLDVPPVTVAGDGGRTPGKVIWRDLLTDTPQQTMAFYRELFGWQFEPLGDANYVLIRHRGRLIGGMVDQNRLPTEVDVSQWVVVMSVADIDRAVGRVSAAGGAVLTPATSLGARGSMAVVTDPQGALLSLLQTRDGDPVDDGELPPEGDFLWDELWTADVPAAGQFLTGLASFNREQLQLGSEQQPVDYLLMSTLGRPRLGVRSRPYPDIEPSWLSFLRVADEAALQGLLQRVEDLGGRVLVPAVARPGGGSVAIVSDPSGAAIALQTWTARQHAAVGEKT